MISSSKTNMQSYEIIISNLAVYSSVQSSQNDNTENSVFQMIGFNYNILIEQINASENIFSINNNLITNKFKKVIFL